jgi:hypothetical protein
LESKPSQRDTISIERKAPAACLPKCPQKKREPNRALAAKAIDDKVSVKPPQHLGVKMAAAKSYVSSVRPNQHQI